MPLQARARRASFPSRFAVERGRLERRHRSTEQSLPLFSHNPPTPRAELAIAGVNSPRKCGQERWMVRPTLHRRRPSATRNAQVGRQRRPALPAYGRNARSALRGRTRRPRQRPRCAMCSLEHEPAVWSSRRGPTRGMKRLDGGAPMWRAGAAYTARAVDLCAPSHCQSSTKPSGSSACGRGPGTGTSRAAHRASKAWSACDAVQRSSGSSAWTHAGGQLRRPLAGSATRDGPEPKIWRRIRPLRDRT